MVPLLSIGLPVHNAAPFLEDTVRSLLAQSFTDWELIAMDDGSTDSSGALLRRIADPRLRLVADGKHLGLSARLNQIVGLARGRYLARMDADDLCHPDRLGRQVAFLDAHPGVDVAGCGLLSFDAALQPVSMRLFPAEHADLCADPLHGIQMAHATVVGRSEWFRRHPYNEGNRTCEDWELWLSNYRHSTFANLREPLYYYRELQSFSLAAYVRGKRDLAALQWSRRGEFGRVRAAVAAAAQYGRLLVYAASSAAGGEEFWIRRRGTAVPPQTASAFRSAVARIAQVRIPEGQT